MKPVEFPEANRIFTKPVNWNEKDNGECVDLHAFQNDEQIISCWELSEHELKQIQETGKIYLSVYAPVQIPVWLAVDNPFKPTCENCLNTCNNPCQISDVPGKYFCNSTCATHWAVNQK